MNKEIKILLNTLLAEVAELKQLAKIQSDEIENLKKQLESVTVVKIEENGELTSDSYGNLILDEIITVKDKLKSLLAQSDLCKKSALDDQGESLDLSQEFSLAELKDELLKLAEMMSL